MIRHLLAGGVSLFLLSAAPVLLSSCCDDDLSTNSIFGEDVKTPERDGFDTWLYLNYTHPYNIQFNYKYVDKESDNTYNLVPADRTKAVAMAKLVKYLWMDSYVELMNDNGLFFKRLGLLRAKTHRSDFSFAIVVRHDVEVLRHHFGCQPTFC